MAVRLSNKLVIDTEEYNDYAIGITLPIQIGNVAFNQSFTTAVQIESNIKNLLLTKKGERLMQPDFGCGLQELLFEPNDSDLESRIEDIINNGFNKSADCVINFGEMELIEEKMDEMIYYYQYIKEKFRMGRVLREKIEEKQNN